MTRKHYLLAGASALTLAFVAAPASAFDTVDWTWNLTVEERVRKAVDINIDITPTGLVLLENLQIFIGDLNATSTVYAIYNNQPATGDGTQTIDLGTLDLQADYALGGDFLDNGFQVCTNNDEIPDCTPVAGNVDETDLDRDLDGVEEVNGTVTAEIPLGTIEVTFDPAGTFDALTELPEVVSAAIAVANNSNITSNVAVEIHEGQFVFNTCGECGRGTEVGIGENYDIGNTHLEIAATLGFAAIAGFIAPAQITATSTVFDILNATVNSAATAVANNKAITIEAPTANDALLMGDITQFAYANVNATSTVNFVSVNNYLNLGLLDRPLVSSTATAVGNNLNINVGIAPIAP